MNAIPGQPAVQTQAARPRRLAPQVLQPSPMDSAPAALASLLQAYRLPGVLIRLRDALQTNIQVPSLDTFQQAAARQGLALEAQWVPLEHLLLAEGGCLPAVTTLTTANGLPHFLILWSHFGARLQVMDPHNGRTWEPAERLSQRLEERWETQSAPDWRAYAGSLAFIAPLRQRLRNLDLPRRAVDRLVGLAIADEGWLSLAALDAALRLAAPLVQAGDLNPGKAAEAAVTRLYEAGRQGGPCPELPEAFWGVLPAAAPDEDRLRVRGVRLLKVVGRIQPGAKPPGKAAAPPGKPAADTQPRPEAVAWRALLHDHVFSPPLLITAVIFSSAMMTIQALLLQALMQIGALLPLASQRLGALGMVVVFLALLSALQLMLSYLLRRGSRQIETTLRTVFLVKIPELSDRWFRRQYVADLSRRSFNLRNSARMPIIAADLLTAAVMLLLTTLGVIWLEPFSAPFAILALVSFILISFYTHPLVEEQENHLFVLNSGMMRYFLDTMLGLTPLKTHGAQRALALEHEAELSDWVRAAYHKSLIEITFMGLVRLVYTAFAVAIVILFILRGGQTSSVLLLLYWTLNIPRLADEFTLKFIKYPLVRTPALRALEPLGDPQDRDVTAARRPEPVAAPPSPSVPLMREAAPPAAAALPPGAAIRLDHVTVKIGENVILDDLSLEIAAGEHLALIGPSGAGKSSLVGLLLGWHIPTRGTVYIDEQPLTGAGYYPLRRQIAWVDPGIQIWNRTLLYNLQYGLHETENAPVVPAIEQAELFSVLENLPQGMQTILGEGGGLVSGGEGQRVRLGRALLRPDARLAILDEPFRGLDRQKRHLLLGRARQWWQPATLICITHDVGETMDFPRVLVMERGRVIEDAPAQRLNAIPTSRFNDLLNAENSLRRGLWSGVSWRRLSLIDGQLSEIDRPAGGAP